MKIRLLLPILRLFFAKVYSQYVLWQIGKQDNSAAEFALAPAGKDKYLANFGGEKNVYSIGYSSPEKNWAYALPGPLDGWAGGGYWAGFYPRHFPRIVFNAKQFDAKSTYKLIFDFVDVNKNNSPTLRVEVNGHRQEIQLPKGNGKALTEKESDGKSSSCFFRNQRRMVEKRIEHDSDGNRRRQLGGI